MSEVAGPHTSSAYDEQLEVARDLVLEMGARAERQLADAMQCLHSGSLALMDQVMRHEGAMNALEMRIDDLAGRIIARHQPTAVDLRLLTMIVKATTDLERIGDEAKKIALQSRRLHADGRPVLLRHVEFSVIATLAGGMLRDALDAMARRDVEGIAAVVRRDRELDAACEGVLRQLLGIMIEDPRTITACLDLVTAVRSLERIGDHAKNIAEYVVYMIKGRDVRHVSLAELEGVARG